MLPGVAPVELIVARTDQTVVAIAGVQAYPAGFSFTVSLRLRTVSVREDQRLHQHGGGGGGSAWDLEHWVWPLPPAGTLAFVCEWPLRGIVETRAEIDAAPILEAAGRAEVLWPEDRGGNDQP